MTQPTVTPRAVLDAAYRSDFRIFLEAVFMTLAPGDRLDEGWYLDAMCHALVRVKRGLDSRLLITIPPRHLKSICTSVAFPAWVMGKHPSAKFLVASYGAELADKLARDFRTVVTQPWFQSAFPKLKLARSVSGEIETTLGGGRKAISVGGVTTGFGADYIVVDDLLKASDAASPIARQAALDYYRESLISRFNNQNTGRLIVIAQRLHEDDLPGHCLETGMFKHLNLPMIAQERQLLDLGEGRTHTRQVGDLLSPERFTAATVERLRLESGTSAFAAQYQQDPTPAASDLIQWSEVKRYDSAPCRRELMMVVQSWDTAFSADPRADCSVGTTWGYDQDAWLLLDVQRFRCNFPELVDRVRQLRDSWRADILLIEEAASGRPLLDELQRERRLVNSGARTPLNWRAQGVTPRVDKRTRFATQVGKLYTGKVLVPEEGRWLDDFRWELVAFPNGRHDDQVDSVSQFLEWTTYARQAIGLDRDAALPQTDGSLSSGATPPRRSARDFIYDRLR